MKNNFMSTLRDFMHQGSNEKEQRGKYYDLYLEAVSHVMEYWLKEGHTRCDAYDMTACWLLEYADAANYFLSVHDFLTIMRGVGNILYEVKL